MKETIQELHLASQYLAAAAICFVSVKADDSHTNLGWESDTNRLTTHVFGRNKNRVALNLETGNLEWFEGKKITQVLDIEKSTHAENVIWLKAQGVKHHLKTPFEYHFHYDLPYPIITSDKVFKFIGSEVADFAKRLTIAKSAFSNFIAQNNLDTTIRVWPHHFDMGIYALVNAEKTISIGAGLAIPDQVVPAMYFYVSGYQNGEPIPTKKLKALNNGAWAANWQGAVLAASHVEEEKAMKFLNESLQAYSMVD
ncbi:hypothetical protein DNU06_02740 [Putridiphycobacter roseus]|uniref:Uncharacterized protein n=1 Tax=Putridiphycobacter roseus TaxID=2219161 RepID=A0A2W1NIB7_9FLAO|nr:hypothetical protein [Putridiphycobacter roseus]PZE18763.1 hypothetical protein DNU06_02740 [Putridiphycobacter roseus]